MWVLAVVYVVSATGGLGRTIVDVSLKEPLVSLMLIVVPTRALYHAVTVTSGSPARAPLNVILHATGVPPASRTGAVPPSSSMQARGTQIGNGEPENEQQESPAVEQSDA